MFGELRAHLFEDFLTVLRFDLVGLGQHRLKGDRGAIEKGHDFLVYVLDPVASVDEDEGTTQGGTTREVLLE